VKFLAAGVVGAVVGIVAFVFGVAWYLEGEDPTRLDID
jgi:hypothetical protein